MIQARQRLICQNRLHSLEGFSRFLSLNKASGMKATTLSLLLSFFCFQLIASNPTNRLVELNKYWSAVDMSFYKSNDLNELSEKEIIRFHLLEVIDSLDRVDLKCYNKEQRTKRAELLNKLRSYANKQEFPQNTYHQKRTPYFIDDYGTACAVGHMIIESGNKEVAQKISREMNYAYIEDMLFPEIDLWAYEHGFSVDELKWIQPGYGPQCPPGVVIQPLCNQPALMNVGCFNPPWQRDSLVQPITYLTEFNIGNGWMVDSNNMWMMMGAMPGQYRITLTDVNNRSIVYNYTIIAPPPILANDQVNQHSSSNITCNGKLTVQPTFGTPPYQITLMNQQLLFVQSNSTGVFDSLCPAVYTIIIDDANNCQGQDSAVIQLTTGLDRYANNEILQFQNPLRGNQLQLRTSLNERKELQLISLNGDVVYSTEFYQNDFRGNLDVPEGLYILQIKNEKQLIRKKLIVYN